MQGLAAGQADHFAALERQLEQQHGQPPPPPQQQGYREEAAQPARKRQRRLEQQQGAAEPTPRPVAPRERASAGPAPTLAQLAAQLDAAGAPAAALQAQQQQQGSQEGQHALAMQQAAPAKLQRFNLFAEEEEAAAAAKRANPENEVGRAGVPAHYCRLQTSLPRRAGLGNLDAELTSTGPVWAAASCPSAHPLVLRHPHSPCRRSVWPGHPLCRNASMTAR